MKKYNLRLFSHAEYNVYNLVLEETKNEFLYKFISLEKEGGKKKNINTTGVFIYTEYIKDPFAVFLSLDDILDIIEQKRKYPVTLYTLSEKDFKNVVPNVYGEVALKELEALPSFKYIGIFIPVDII